MAFAALEVAALDLALRADGVSLADRLGRELGSTTRHRRMVRGRRAWPTIELDHRRDRCRTGGGCSSGQAEDHARARCRTADGGYVIDYPDLSLAADANGSYPSVDAVPAELAQLGLAYLEQPLAPDDLRGAAALAGTLGVPVALDESLTSAERLDEAVSIGRAVHGVGESGPARRDRRSRPRAGERGGRRIRRVRGRDARDGSGPGRCPRRRSSGPVHAAG